MSNANDFIIENGVLKKYVGPGGDVIVPDGVTAINNNVFQNNITIKTVFLPDGLRYIYRGVFQNCSGLVSVRIPESLWFVDDSAFENCTALEEVTLPKTMNQIGNAVFRNCSGLKKITVPGALNRIDFYTFSGLSKLQEMVIPCDPMDTNQIKFLATNLLLPDELRELLMKGVIRTCAPLEKAMLKRINTAQYRKKSMELFLGKKDKESVSAFLKLIPKMSAEELDGYIQAAKNQPEIQTLILDYKNSLYSSASLTAEESTKMSKASEFKITKAGILKSWEGNPCEAVIPEGVVEIGKKVFYSCDKLSKVVIPEGVKIIGENAFQECTRLAEITLPHSLETIESGAFFFTSLKNITIPEGVTCIGDSAFCLTQLKTVVIPQSVKSIGARAFNTINGVANKGTITDVTILGSEVTIGTKAFPEGFQVRIYAPNAPLSLFSAEYKRQIIFTYLTSNAEYSSVRVEEYNKYIDKTDDFIGLLIKDNQVEALSKLLQIKSKVNPEKLDGFLAQAEKNPEITAALLAYQAKMFQPQTREKAEKRKIDIALGEKPRTVAEWKKLFGFEKREDGLVITAYKGFENIAEVPEKIGKDTVVAIGDNAFSPFVPRAQNKEARRTLCQVILPETIREIGKNAFYNCSCLDSVVIPSSVEKIGDRAFDSCKNLSSIGIPNYRCSNITIHAPASSYAETYAKENNIPFVAE